MQKPKKKEHKQQSLPAACYLRSRYLPVIIRTISCKSSRIQGIGRPHFARLGLIFADQAFSTLSNEIVLIRNPGRTKRRIRMTYRGLSENAARFSKVFSPVTLLTTEAGIGNYRTYVHNPWAFKTRYRL